MDQPEILDELPPQIQLRGFGRAANPAVAAARTHPGKWVSYSQYKNSSSAASKKTQLKRGLLVSFDSALHDVEHRTHDDGTATVYIRYHGGQS